MAKPRKPRKPGKKIVKKRINVSLRNKAGATARGRRMAAVLGPTPGYESHKTIETVVDVPGSAAAKDRVLKQGGKKQGTPKAVAKARAKSGANRPATTSRRADATRQGRAGTRRAAQGRAAKPVASRPVGNMSRDEFNAEYRAALTAAREGEPGAAARVRQLREHGKSAGFLNKDGRPKPPARARKAAPERPERPARESRAERDAAKRPAAEQPAERDAAERPQQNQDNGWRTLPELEAEWVDASAHNHQHELADTDATDPHDPAQFREAAQQMRDADLEAEWAELEQDLIDLGDPPRMDTPEDIAALDAAIDAALAYGAELDARNNEANPFHADAPELDTDGVDMPNTRPGDEAEWLTGLNDEELGRVIRDAKPELRDMADEEMERRYPWREDGVLQRMLPHRTMTDIRREQKRLLGDGNEVHDKQGIYKLAGAAGNYRYVRHAEDNFQTWLQQQAQQAATTNPGDDLHDHEVGAFVGSGIDSIGSPIMMQKLDPELRAAAARLGYIPNRANWARIQRGEAPRPYNGKPPRRRRKATAKATPGAPNTPRDNTALNAGDLRPDATTEQLEEELAAWENTLSQWGDSPTFDSPNEAAAHSRALDNYLTTRAALDARTDEANPFAADLPDGDIVTDDRGELPELDGTDEVEYLNGLDDAEVERLASDPDTPHEFRNLAEEELEHRTPWRDGGILESMLAYSPITKVERAQKKYMGDNGFDRYELEKRMAEAGNDRYRDSIHADTLYEGWLDSTVARHRGMEETNTGPVSNKEFARAEGIENYRNDIELQSAPEEIKLVVSELGFIPNKANFMRSLRGEPMVHSDPMTSMTVKFGRGKRRTADEIMQDALAKQRRELSRDEKRRARDTEALRKYAKKNVDTWDITPEQARANVEKASAELAAADKALAADRAPNDAVRNRARDARARLQSAREDVQVADEVQRLRAERDGTTGTGDRNTGDVDTADTAANAANVAREQGDTADAARRADNATDDPYELGNMPDDELAEVIAETDGDPSPDVRKENRAAKREQRRRQTATTGTNERDTNAAAEKAATDRNKADADARKQRATANAIDGEEVTEQGNIRRGNALMWENRDGTYSVQPIDGERVPRGKGMKADTLDDARRIADRIGAGEVPNERTADNAGKTKVGKPGPNAKTVDAKAEKPKADAAKPAKKAPKAKPTGKTKPVKNWRAELTTADGDMPLVESAPNMSDDDLVTAYKGLSADVRRYRAEANKHRKAKNTYDARSATREGDRYETQRSQIGEQLRRRGFKLNALDKGRQNGTTEQGDRDAKSKRDAENQQRNDAARVTHVGDRLNYGTDLEGLTDDDLRNYRAVLDAAPETTRNTVPENITRNLAAEEKRRGLDGATADTADAPEPDADAERKKITDRGDKHITDALNAAEVKPAHERYNHLTDTELADAYTAAKAHGLFTDIGGERGKLESEMKRRQRRPIEGVTTDDKGRRHLTLDDHDQATAAGIIYDRLVDSDNYGPNAGDDEITVDDGNGHALRFGTLTNRTYSAMPENGKDGAMVTGDNRDRDVKNIATALRRAGFPSKTALAKRRKETAAEKPKAAADAAPKPEKATDAPATKKRITVKERNQRILDGMDGVGFDGTTSDIAKASGLTNQQALRALSDLEDYGLVRRGNEGVGGGSGALSGGRVKITDLDWHTTADDLADFYEFRGIELDAGDIEADTNYRNALTREAYSHALGIVNIDKDGSKVEAPGRRDATPPVDPKKQAKAADAPKPKKAAAAQGEKSTTGPNDGKFRVIDPDTIERNGERITNRSVDAGQLAEVLNARNGQPARDAAPVLEKNGDGTATLKNTRDALGLNPVTFPEGKTPGDYPASLRVGTHRNGEYIGDGTYDTLARLEVRIDGDRNIVIDNANGVPNALADEARASVADYLERHGGVDALMPADAPDPRMSGMAEPGSALTPDGVKKSAARPVDAPKADADDLMQLPQRERDIAVYNDVQGETYTTAEVAEMTGLTPAQARATLNRLEANGLVFRSDDNDDQGLGSRRNVSGGRTSMDNLAWTDAYRDDDGAVADAVNAYDPKKGAEKPTPAKKPATPAKKATDTPTVDPKKQQRAADAAEKHTKAEKAHSTATAKVERAMRENTTDRINADTETAAINATKAFIRERNAKAAQLRAEIAANPDKDTPEARKAIADAEKATKGAKVNNIGSKEFKAVKADIIAAAEAKRPAIGKPTPKKDPVDEPDMTPQEVSDMFDALLEATKNKKAGTATPTDPEFERRQKQGLGRGEVLPGTLKPGDHVITPYGKARVKRVNLNNVVVENPVTADPRRPLPDVDDLTVFRYDHIAVPPGSDAAFREPDTTGLREGTAKIGDYPTVGLGRAPHRSDYYTTAELEERGWTPAKLKSIVGKPDGVKKFREKIAADGDGSQRGDYSGYNVNLYSRARIELAEADYPDEDFGPHRETEKPTIDGLDIDRVATESGRTIFPITNAKDLAGDADLSSAWLDTKGKLNVRGDDKARDRIQAVIDNGPPAKPDPRMSGMAEPGSALTPDGVEAAAPSIRDQIQDIAKPAGKVNVARRKAERESPLGVKRAELVARMKSHPEKDTMPPSSRSLEWHQLNVELAETELTQGERRLAQIEQDIADFKSKGATDKDLFTLNARQKATEAGVDKDRKQVQAARKQASAKQAEQTLAADAKKPADLTTKAPGGNKWEVTKRDEYPVEFTKIGPDKKSPEEVAQWLAEFATTFKGDRKSDESISIQFQDAMVGAWAREGNTADVDFYLGMFARGTDVQDAEFMVGTPGVAAIDAEKLARTRSAKSARKIIDEGIAKENKQVGLRLARDIMLDESRNDPRELTFAVFALTPGNIRDNYGRVPKDANAEEARLAANIAERLHQAAPDGQGYGYDGVAKAFREVANQIDPDGAPTPAATLDPRSNERIMRETARAELGVDGDLVIEHTPEGGTLIHGTSRGDGTSDVLKANGWRWSRNLGAWYVPRTRDQRPDGDKIDRTATALEADGHKVGTDIDDTVRSAAEREAAKAERADDRADALANKADRKRAAADTAWQKDKEATDRVPPMGEPVKVGHHSERGHRRAIDRAWQTLGNALEAEKDAKEANRRAAVAARANDARNDPITVANRIDGLEADIRRMERARVTGPELDTARDDLTYWRGVHEQHIADGKIASQNPDDYKPGMFIVQGNRLYRIAKVNKKTLSVETEGPTEGKPGLSKIGLNKIRGRQVTPEEADAILRELVADMSDDDLRNKIGYNRSVHSYGVRDAMKAELARREGTEPPAPEMPLTPPAPGEYVKHHRGRILKRHVKVDEGETLEKGKIKRGDFTIGNSQSGYTVTDAAGNSSLGEHGQRFDIDVARERVDAMQADRDLLGRDSEVLGRSDKDLARLAETGSGDRRRDAQELLAARNPVAEQQARNFGEYVDDAEQARRAAAAAANPPTRAQRQHLARLRRELEADDGDRLPPVQPIGEVVAEFIREMDRADERAAALEGYTDKAERRAARKTFNDWFNKRDIEEWLPEAERLREADAARFDRILYADPSTMSKDEASEAIDAMRGGRHLVFQPMPRGLDGKDGSKLSPMVNKDDVKRLRESIKPQQGTPAAPTTPGFVPPGSYIGENGIVTPETTAPGTVTLEYDAHGNVDRRQVLAAFADGVYVNQVFGPDRPRVAQSIAAHVRGIMPTKAEVTRAAYGYGDERRINAYRNGREYLLSAYSGYVSPDDFPSLDSDDLPEGE